MNVLSLFDGMSCGMIAAIVAGVPVDNYFAYEIDKYAIQTSQHNFPNIVHCGNVFDADFTQYAGGQIDFLVGGSPCTYWSIAKTKGRETTASGFGWELFSQYVRAWKQAQPKYFIYENNVSMSKEIRDSITETFGFEPVMINSALVSAQNRKRLYWVGVRNDDGTYSPVPVEQPNDRGILLKDILDDAVVIRDNDKSRTMTASYPRTTEREFFAKRQNELVAQPLSDGEMNYMVGDCGAYGNRWSFLNRPGTDDKARIVVANMAKGVPYNICAVPYELQSVSDSDAGVIATLDMPKGNHDIVKRVYGTNGKSPTLNSMNGGNREPKVFQMITERDGKQTTVPVYEVIGGHLTFKGVQYPVKLPDGLYIIRKLSVPECKRLQTVPDWFEFPVSKTQALKMLGNGWTVR